MRKQRAFCRARLLVSSSVTGYLYIDAEGREKEGGFPTPPPSPPLPLYPIEGHEKTTRSATLLLNFPCVEIVWYLFIGGGASRGVLDDYWRSRKRDDVDERRQIASAQR